MCVGVWALEHPDYALILCSNRDEFLSRPTRNAHFHAFENGPVPDHPGNVLSGRDERAGGSWFGVNRAGRVAVLTNITEPPKQYTTSRGYLLSSFLLSDASHPLEDEIGKVLPQNTEFAGFNLLLLDPTFSEDNSVCFDNVLFVTNHGSGGALSTRPLSADERRCGGMSNGIDGAGATDWPKVKHATRDLDAILQSLNPETTDTELADRLFELLAWRSPEPVVQRSQLRNTVHVAPCPIILEGAKKETSDKYGTRLSTVLLIRRDGQVLFVEKDIWKLVDEKAVLADPSNKRVHRFRLHSQSRL